METTKANWLVELVLRLLCLPLRRVEDAMQQLSDHCGSASIENKGGQEVCKKQVLMAKLLGLRDNAQAKGFCPETFTVKSFWFVFLDIQ